MSENEKLPVLLPARPPNTAPVSDARAWSLREKVYKMIDSLVMARILEMRPGNAREQKFRLNLSVPKVGSYIFSNEACGIREPGRNCYLLQDLLFDHLGVIPTYCMKRCWKIITKVKNVAEIFALLEVMKQHAWPGKCGFDGRNHTFGTWVGFRYFTSREEAEQAFDDTVAAVHEVIPQAHLYLKRSCTEYELKPRSNIWNQDDPLADALAEFLEKWVEWDVVDYDQTEYLESRIKNYWIEKAYNLGDPSLEQIVPNYREMVLQSVKYRESPPPPPRS